MHLFPGIRIKFNPFSCKLLGLFVGRFWTKLEVYWQLLPLKCCPSVDLFKLNYQILERHLEMMFETRHSCAPKLYGSIWKCFIFVVLVHTWDGQWIMLMGKMVKWLIFFKCFQHAVSIRLMLNRTNFLIWKTGTYYLSYLCQLDTLYWMI